MVRGRKPVVMYERICFDCKKLKPIEEFAKWRKICKDCLNSWKRARRKLKPDEPRSQNLHRSRDWYRKNKDEVLAASRARYKENLEYVSNIKSTTPCADCKKIYDPICMDFDHLDPSIKLNKISELIKGHLKNVIDEMAKCEIVCSNCHRIRTRDRKLNANKENKTS